MQTGIGFAIEKIITIRKLVKTSQGVSMMSLSKMFPFCHFVLIDANTSYCKFHIKNLGDILLKEINFFKILKEYGQNVCQSLKVPL